MEVQLLFPPGTGHWDGFGDNLLAMFSFTDWQI